MAENRHGAVSSDNRQRQEQATAAQPPFSWLGVGFAAMAAIGYTLANAFLRELSEETPHEWVVTCKATCTTLIFLPWLVILAAKRVKLFPPISVCALLVFAAVTVQLGGNLAYQWALSQIGLALSVPILMSILIISGASLGFLFLKEPVTHTMKFVIILFVIAIFMLGLGTAELGEPGEEAIVRWPILGAFAAALAGFAYAILGVSVRTSVKFDIPLATPMVFVGLIGTVIVGSLTFQQHGFEIVAETSQSEWGCLIAAALSNSLAFLCLTKAFKHLPVVYVNMTNIAQVAMATLIALFFFDEPFTIWLGIGLAIVVIGYLILARQPTKPKPKV